MDCIEPDWTTCSFFAQNSFDVHNLPQRDQGIEIIRAIVADCLARELTEVRRDSRLITELGADSLDFVDLIFTLEKRFGVRIQENDLNRGLRPDASGTNAEFLSSDAITRLLPWLPQLANLPDLKQVRPAQVLPLVTVESLWQLVEQKAKTAASA